MGEGADRVGSYYAAVRQNLVKFCYRLLPLSCRQVRLAAYVGRIEAAESGVKVRAGHGEVVRDGSLQSLDCVEWMMVVESEERAQSREIFELHRGVLGEALPE